MENVEPWKFSQGPEEEELPQDSAILDGLISIEAAASIAGSKKVIGTYRSSSEFLLQAGDGSGLQDLSNVNTLGWMSKKTSFRRVDYRGLNIFPTQQSIKMEKEHMTGIQVLFLIVIA